MPSEIMRGKEKVYNNLYYLSVYLLMIQMSQWACKNLDS